MELNSLEELERKSCETSVDTNQSLQAEPKNPVETAADSSSQCDVAVFKATSVLSDGRMLEQSLGTLSLQSPQPASDSPNVYKKASSSSRSQNGSKLQREYVVCYVLPCCEYVVCYGLPCCEYAVCYELSY